MTIAEAALYSPTYNCDAFAETPSRVRAFRKASLRARLRSEPDLADSLAHRAFVQVAHVS
jgi:hypothetical protein